jgi:hypothetical protein
MPDPISRLQLAQQEIDRVLGGGYAREHPDVVAVVVQSASSDYAVPLPTLTKPSLPKATSLIASGR